MSAQPMPAVSPDEYLDAERLASHKSEYVSGQIWAMSGASVVHNRIAFNLGGLLYAALQGGPCEAFGSDMRVLVAENNTYAYPDLSIVCGEQTYSDTVADTLTNPTVLVEILSPSTAQYDLTVKRIKYQRLPSLQAYLVVHQDTPRVEHFTRFDTLWISGEATGLDATLSLETPAVALPLAEIYARVPFPAP